MKFGKYHKGASKVFYMRSIAELDLWKRDNIQVFANATLRLGVPKSALISYSFFESKNVCFYHHYHA